MTLGEGQPAAHQPRASISAFLSASDPPDAQNPLPPASPPDGVRRNLTRRAVLGEDRATRRGRRFQRLWGRIADGAGVYGAAERIPSQCSSSHLQAVMTAFAFGVPADESARSFIQYTRGPYWVIADGRTCPWAKTLDVRVSAAISTIVPSSTAE
jgi:hypothetical protein